MIRAGVGRGDILTPDSSSFLIARDPFRAIVRGRQLFQRKFTQAQGVGPRTNDGEGDIHFKAIDALGFHLLQAVASNDGELSGETLLRGLAAQAGVADADAFVANGGRLLNQLRERAVILGIRR